MKARRAARAGTSRPPGGPGPSRRGTVERSAGTVEPGDVERALDAIDVAARDLEMSAASRAQFAAYLETLLLWRQRISLTTAATPGAIAQEHIIDSLAVARRVRSGMRIADVGSGAGFPGVPVAIVRPAATVILIEPRRKRANFLRDVVRRAGLFNVEVTESRVESLPLAVARPFDLMVCRAFGSLDAFLRFALPLLVPGGTAVAMKGPRGVAEAAATASPSYDQPEVLRYPLPNGVEHLLLLYRRR